MNAKALALIACLLALTYSCQAVFYMLNSHTIEIEVDADGSANVTERYFLLFQNEQQTIDFRQTVSNLGISLEDWRKYDDRIYPRIGLDEDIRVQGIEFIEDPALDYLQITYSLNTPIMEKKRETSRVIEYGLKEKFFNQFRQGQLWVVPQATSIVVRLPKGVEIKSSVKPDATIEQNSVAWNGYLTGNELFMEYTVFKEIASFDLREAIQQLMQSELFLIVVAAAALVFLLVFAKRKSIANRVQNYVIEHSDFGGEETEE